MSKKSCWLSQLAVFAGLIVFGAHLQAADIKKADVINPVTVAGDFQPRNAINLPPGFKDKLVSRLKSATQANPKSSAQARTSSSPTTHPVPKSTTTIFYDSFETTGANWTNVPIYGTSASWSRVSSGSYPSVNPYAGSWMAQFNSFDANSGDATAIINTAFSSYISSSYSSVYLTFWMYHDTDYASNGDAVILTFSVDGGYSFEDVGDVYYRYDGRNGWYQHSIDISAYRGQTISSLALIGMSGYGNNIYMDAITISGVVSNSPDLVVTSVTAGYSAQPGGTLTGNSAVVKNQGTANAGASRLNYYLSTNNTITQSDINTHWGCDVPTLSSGQTFTCSGSIGIPSSVPLGTYYVGAYADDTYLVGESDGNNNSLAASHTTDIVGANYIVTPSAGPGGSISPNTPQTVNSGATASFTITPNAGNTANVGGTCGGTLSGATYTTNAITANCTVVATFTPITYTVTPSAGTGGSVSPNTIQTVVSGSTKSFTVTPNSGHTRNSTVGGNCPQGSWSSNIWTTGPINANCNVSFSFVPNPVTYTVTPSAGSGGSISPSTPQIVNSGATVNFTIVSSGNAINVGGTCGGNLSGTTYTTNPVTSNCTVVATFTSVVYTVTPSAGPGGSVSPSIQQTVSAGAAKSFTVTPNSGFTHSSTVGGTCPQGSWVVNTWTTGPINANCNVIFSFVQNNVTYTVTPLMGPGGRVSPNTPQTVVSGAAKSFVVTPNVGYVMGPHAVLGTCPPGHWSGNIYSTGGITANCNVQFRFMCAFCLRGMDGLNTLILRK